MCWSKERNKEDIIYVWSLLWYYMYISVAGHKREINKINFYCYSFTLFKPADAYVFQWTESGDGLSPVWNQAIITRSN